VTPCGRRRKTASDVMQGGDEMDATTWEQAANALEMLSAIQARASGRKLRLFALACCRRRDGLVAAGPCREALAVVERLTEEAVSARQIQLLRDNLGQVGWESRGLAAALELLLDDATAFDGAYRIATHLSTGRSALRAHPALLREVMGNPFRAVAVDPAWLAWEGGLVRGMAQVAHDGRAFDRLPVLADALEDAGCDSAELLAHLRGGGPHLPGCWALDAVLGKA
jgi:hypothetical protein